MQETRWNDEKQAKLLQEFFDGKNEQEIKDKMDKRLVTLENEGHTLIRRVPNIGRNHPCPCGSGKKFKKCCISKVK